MPTPLPIIDLSAASKGTKGTIDLTAAAPTSNPAYILKNAIVQIYNDSGCGLRLSYRESGGGADLPAGAWKNLNIDAGEHFIDYVVVYFMANAPVSSLLATYFSPNEITDHFGSLGNSPIGLSSNVPLSATATAIANDGNPTGTEFIEASVASVKNVSVKNDGSGFFSNNAFNWTASGAIGCQTVFCTELQSDGAKFFSDGSGNVTCGTITLRTGVQESGHFSIAFSTPIIMGWSFWIRFRQIMTNIPSSITISNTTLVNITGNLTTPTITKDGFQVNCSVTAANTITDVIFDWVTVGN